MCNNIKLFKKYYELPDIIIHRNDSVLDKYIYEMFIKMLKKNCKCLPELRFKEEQLHGLD
jgi:hypothetical protein